ncbi:MAG: GNAT family N-acetyltransferase [Planctomycetota bacterium]
MRVRAAGQSDLPALYELARRSLMFDSFSRELLAEKLFRNPSSGRDEYRVYAAEQAGTIVGMMQAVLRPDQAKGWLGLFAVDPSVRRQGIASALLRQVREYWQDAGAHGAEILTIPGNYFTPGLDPRYTAAVCFLERAGFERSGDCVNLIAELEDHIDTAAKERRLAAEGIAVRRASVADELLLDGFFDEHFGRDWRLEAGLALHNDPAGLHLALADGRIIAFSAHSTQNREWGFFGPMGTAPQARGRGLGRVLLWRCLNDLGAAGHKTAVIPWVGPIAFYSHYAGCRVERVLWRYRLTLQSGAD